MKLSTRARYSLRMMLYFARLTEDGTVVSLHEVAKRSKISRRYLEQVVIALKKASLIKGTAGKNGGYVLSRPAEQIKISEIVEAAIGPINIVNCVNQPQGCQFSDLCECRQVYQLINGKINEVLYQISLADMADRDRLKLITTRLESLKSD
jgi:Rrf2 family protein